MAKLSVSAPMFDYILTGPISGVAAGQYVIGLIGELFHLKPYRGKPAVRNFRGGRGNPKLV